MASHKPFRDSSNPEFIASVAQEFNENVRKVPNERRCLQRKNNETKIINHHASDDQCVVLGSSMRSETSFQSAQPDGVVDRTFKSSDSCWSFYYYHL